MKVDAFSKEWLAVRDYCVAEIEAERTWLETKGLATEDSEYARGRIAALRGVLGLTEQN